MIRAINENKHVIRESNNLYESFIFIKSFSVFDIHTPFAISIEGVGRSLLKGKHLVII